MSNAIEMIARESEEITEPVERNERKGVVSANSMKVNKHKHECIRQTRKTYTAIIQTYNNRQNNPHCEILRKPRRPVYRIDSKHRKKHNIDRKKSP